MIAKNNKTKTLNHKPITDNLLTKKIMPTISLFYGILVRMHLGLMEHNPPHIHVFYQDYSAIVDIKNIEFIGGNFPNKQKRLVLAWIELHQDDLLKNWELAQNGEIPFKIEPLR